MYNATFTNPPSYSDGVQYTNPDPYLLHYFGTYYCYSTDEQGVKLSISKDMVHWVFHSYCYQELGRCSYWAPCVIYRNGTFFMYVSTRPAGTTDPHLQRMRVATSDSPTGPFVFHNQMLDSFAIDADVCTGQDGVTVMFYASNELTERYSGRLGTSVVVDIMPDPYSLLGKPKPVIMPSNDQEIFQVNRFGDGRDWYTIEGSTYFETDQYAYQTYSGNAYENPDYFIGLARAKKAPSLYDLEWEKIASGEEDAPLIKQNSLIEGTGHNSIIRGPNLIDRWIIYHGRDRNIERNRHEEQRLLYIDRILDTDNIVTTPAPLSEPQRVPEPPTFQGDETGVSLNRKLLGADLDDFCCEIYMRSDCANDNDVKYSIEVMAESRVLARFEINTSGIAYVSSSYEVKKDLPFSIPVDLQCWQPWRIERKQSAIQLYLAQVKMAEVPDKSHPEKVSVIASTSGNAEVGYWRLTEFSDYRCQALQQALCQKPGVELRANGKDSSSALTFKQSGTLRFELMFNVSTPPPIKIHGEELYRQFLNVKDYSVWSIVARGNALKPIQLTSDFSDLICCRVTKIASSSTRC